jgi:hypothetical protein
MQLKFLSPVQTALWKDKWQRWVKRGRKREREQDQARFQAHDSKAEFGSKDLNALSRHTKALTLAIVV